MALHKILRPVLEVIGVVTIGGHTVQRFFAVFLPVTGLLNINNLKCEC